MDHANINVTSIVENIVSQNKSGITTNVGGCLQKKIIAGILALVFVRVAGI